MLKRNRGLARACGFRQKTPSHGLFTQFRHRLGRNGYEKVFSLLLGQLLKRRAVNGEVVALDGTAIKAYSQRSLDNKTGKSDCDARVGRGRRGFISAIMCMWHAAQAVNCPWHSRLRLAT